MTGCWRRLANLRAIRAKISQQPAVNEGLKASRCVILVYADWYSRNHGSSFELQVGSNRVLQNLFVPTPPKTSPPRTRSVQRDYESSQRKEKWILSKIRWLLA